MSDLYDDLIAAGCKVDNHESDLYVEKTDKSIEIIKAHGLHAESFKNQVTGTTWLEVVLMFSPWWRERGLY